MAVKKNIEDAQGKGNYPCGQQLLIHNGKVLKDETTLADNKGTEDGFHVVMLSKTKTLGSAGASSTQPIVTEINYAIGAEGIVSNECKEFIYEYGDQIWDLLASGVQPNQ